MVNEEGVLPRRISVDSNNYPGIPHTEEVESTRFRCMCDEDCPNHKKLTTMGPYCHACGNKLEEVTVIEIHHYNQPIEPMKPWDPNDDPFKPTEPGRPWGPTIID